MKIDTEPEPSREVSVTDMRKVISCLLDVLECPVCYQELYPPIYQCNNGHPVCSSCRPRVRACPVCKAWMYHVRALALEKIIRELPRPCRYLPGGCTERVSAAARAQHERCCPHRPARCVEALVSCSWKGPLVEARAHLASKHELSERLHRAMHGRFSFSLGCVGQEKFLEDTTESVLFRCLIRADRGKLYFLCHALTANDRAEMYAFRVLVTNRCSERRLSYEGPVLSVFQSVSKTIDASQGLRVGRDWLLKACSCRAGQFCFDTTWQLTRRSELAQAERDLRNILAGAYPEPHIGSHDRTAGAPPPAARQGSRTVTPSRGQRAPPAGAAPTRCPPGSGRLQPPVRQQPRAEGAAPVSSQDSAGAGELPPTTGPSASGTETESPGREATSSDTGASAPSSNQERESSVAEASGSPSSQGAEPSPSSDTLEAEASSPADSEEQGPGGSTKTEDEAVESDQANSQERGAIGPSAYTPEDDEESALPRNPDRETGASESTIEAKDAVSSDSLADEPLPSSETSKSSAMARPPGASEVSAVCYAAALARLSSTAPCSRKDGDCSNEEVSYQPGVQAAEQPDLGAETVVTSPDSMSKDAAAPSFPTGTDSTAAASPSEKSQSDIVPETAELQSDAVSVEA
ncbi:putative E3 ubiquitin-protein ligase sinah [Amphibalanus amphitrite]|uniref:RING-type E3 ubiquitin transferase n=1 Tax=Amphibalanus amphitrite TaxID=1232801 RepID=A0A6A4W7N6_AMPAM|nr:putative E3 ubiquitin-protein ligase sinah [Amphibalanus amphitrite]